MQRNELGGAAALTVLSAEQFKTSRISIYFILPSKRQTATAFALLPQLLERGYAGCPDMIDVIFIGAVMAVICARAYYVVFAPFKYTSFAQMLDIRDGGLAIYGGVLGAFIFGGLASKWRKVPILPMFDITAIGFFIGQAMGRWGNFVNQEAFGTNTTLPWGMKPNRLHSGAVKFVSAKGQFEALRFIEPLLTDEERDMRWGSSTGASARIIFVSRRMAALFWPGMPHWHCAA